MKEQCGVYARLSQQGETEESVSRQIDLCTAAARARGYEVVLYVEPPGLRSGYYESNRPEWLRMRQDIENGTLAAVMVADLARASRNAMNTLAFVEFVFKRGVQFLSLKENIDPSTPAGKLMITVIAAVNEWFRNDLSERKKIQYRARDPSIFASNTAPFGMARAGHYPNIVWSKTDDFATIAELFRLYLLGHGAGYIAQSLAARGYTWVNRRGERHHNISMRTVSNCIEKAERYRPLLTAAMLTEIVAERERRSCSASIRSREPFPPPLLRGLLFCERCGHRYVARHYNVRDRKGLLAYSYLGYTHRLPPHCGSKPYTVQAHVLDGQVLERLAAFRMSADDLDYVAAKIVQELTPPDAGRIEAELAKVAAERERLARGWLAANLSDDMHAKLSAELDARAEALKKERVRDLPSFESVRVRLENLSKLLSDKYTSDPYAANAALRGIVDKVYIWNGQVARLEWGLVLP